MKERIEIKNLSNGGCRSHRNENMNLLVQIEF